MSQVYHSNARLNRHSREIIQNSKLKNIELVEKFGVYEKTITKWKARNFTADKSSRLKTIHYHFRFSLQFRQILFFDLIL